MLCKSIRLCVGLLMVVSAELMFGQQPATVVGSTSASSLVPPLVSFSGVLSDGNGKALSGVVGVTFALYKDAQGGSPLWLETQNVYPDKTGRYTVLLGSTTSTGLPSDLFVSGEARWLGVQVQGQSEQPRVSLLSVPYALKAGDAQTIGGLPPSAFVLAAPPTSSSTGTAPTTAAVQPMATGTTPVTTAGGTINVIPKWDATADITNSQIFDNATNVGIGTASPAAKLDVKGTAAVRGLFTLPAIGTATSTGYTSQPLKMVASAFNSGTGTAIAQNFQLQAEPVGSNTSSTSGTLNLLYSTGSNKLAETGLSIASNGLITFAAGQTFPGTGTGNGSVTSVALTAPSTDFIVTGSPVTTSGTLGLGWITAPDYNNTPNAIVKRDSNGNFSAGTINAANGFNLGGSLFNSGSFASGNAFLGFAGNTSTTGGYNTAAGVGALANDTSGSYDTAVGAYANVGVNNLTNATAIGAHAQVTQNNSLVLGSINGVNGATANTNVGIGTTAPTQSLEVDSGNVMARGANNFKKSGDTAFFYVGDANHSLEALYGSGLAIGAYKVPQALFLQDQTGRVGVGTTTPAYTLDVNGTGNFTGLVNFASGQTFPGAGSVTSIGLTAPSTDFIVTGSPVTTSGTLGLGWITAPDFNNTPNAIVKRDSSGNFSAGTINAATAYNLGGYPFAFGSYNSQNAFFGFAGNTTTTGPLNTASGYWAFLYNTTGQYNTASGADALQANTTGSFNSASSAMSLTSNISGNSNTASGYYSLGSNTTGSYNTAVGYMADVSSGNLTNATAIGANAQVAQSNSLVLGGIHANAVNVGIGTITPAYTLDVQGSGRFTQPVVFAANQTFPGTITQITAGTDLTGGGLGGNVTLNVDTTKVVTGVTAGTDLTGGGTGGVLTLNLDTTKVPQLAASNSFSGTQTITSSGSGLDIYLTGSSYLDGVTVWPGSNGYAFYSTGGYSGLWAYGSALPVYAYTSNGGEAVFATNSNTTGGSMGVYGVASGSTTGQTYGVLGNNWGSNYGAGVYGQISTSGLRSGTGSKWIGAAGAGVWGDGGTSGNYGVLGTADDHGGVFAENNSAGYSTLVAFNQNSSGYPFWAFNTANNKGCTIDNYGDLNCAGTENAVVPIDGGQRKVALSVIESPKNWFEDAGSAQLVNGVAVVTIDPEFMQTVNTEVEYQVFLTPYGDCKGLYVTSRTANSFAVHELGGGTASLSFGYRIMALRKNYENVRFADHTNDPDPVKMMPKTGTPYAFDSSKIKPPEAPARPLRPATQVGRPTMSNR